jgi:hypothetical protein
MVENMVTKFCKDCEHITRPMQCGHENSLKHVNVVTGEKYYHYCAEAREALGSCGPEATLFEQKKSQ